jgi:phosphoenolpyruvate carboxykinase (ATP)
MRYAELFGERLDRHGSDVWLVNTGWTGGPYGVGERMPIAQTRAIVAAILDGSLDDVAFDVDPLFGFAVPRSIANVPSTLLRPRDTWPDSAAYDDTARRLARDLEQNFVTLTPSAAGTVREAGPATG